MVIGRYKKYQIPRFMRFYRNKNFTMLIFCMFFLIYVGLHTLMGHLAVHVQWTVWRAL